MKDDLKSILYMGLGALYEVKESTSALKDDLYQKGKDLYEKGVIANEELKHNISKAMKDNVHVVTIHEGSSKEAILENIERLSLEDKKALMQELNKKGWMKNGEGRKDS